MITVESALTTYTKKFARAVDRLVISVEFNPESSTEREYLELWIEHQLREFCETLSGIPELKNMPPLTLKLETVLRVLGYRAIDIVSEYGHACMADTKLSSISHTLKADGAIISKHTPKIVTIMCGNGPKNIHAFVESFRVSSPHTKILGVVLPTDLDDEDIWKMYMQASPTFFGSLAHATHESGLDGFVCSAHQIEKLERVLEADLFKKLAMCAPAIRSKGITIANDDQNPKRTTTPSKAIRLGARYLIVGRQITQSNDPRAALLRVLGEMAEEIRPELQ